MSCLPNRFPAVSVFPDRVFLHQWLPPKDVSMRGDDLKFSQDETRKETIIEAPAGIYIDLNFYNWDDVDREDTIIREASNKVKSIKWFNFHPTRGTKYRLIPKGFIIKDHSKFGVSNDTITNVPLLTELPVVLDGKKVGVEYTFNENTWVEVDSKSTHVNNKTWIGDVTDEATWNLIRDNEYIPIKLTIGDNIEFRDITNYKTNKTPQLSLNLRNQNFPPEFFFDGNNLKTNFDFSLDDNIRSSVKIEYQSLTKNIKVKAILRTNSVGKSFYTPLVDNYVLKISNQRVGR